MTRFALLFLALGSSTACIVGTVPPSDEPPAGVVCEKKVAPEEGKHYSGMPCTTGCHKSTGKMDNPNPFFIMSGTVFEKADGAKPVEGATVIIEWAGGSAKYPTGNMGTEGDGRGNFYEYAEVAGITFPATAKVSLCPDPEKVMQTPLNNAGDLDCTKSGCHTSSLRIFLK